MIYVLYKKVETRRFTSFLYVNLAMADLLVTCVVMPHQLQTILMDTRWFGGAFGEFLAKFVVFTFFVALMASIYFLTAIAFDCFFSIVFSLRQFPRFRSKKLLVPCIWLFSMSAMSPWLIIIGAKDVTGNGQHFVIEHKFSRLGEKDLSVRGVYLYTITITYALPLGIMSGLYGYICQRLRLHKVPGASVDHDKARLRVNKTKRQIIKMSVAMVITFALCWLPTHICHAMLAIDLNWAFTKFPSFEYFMLVSYWLGHANSAVKPWMLIYFKKRFRSVFRKMITHPLSRLSAASRTSQDTATKRPSFKVAPAAQPVQITTHL